MIGERTERRRRSRLRKRVGLGFVGLAALAGGAAAGILMRGDAPVSDPVPTESASEPVLPLEVTLLAVSSTFDGSHVLSMSPLLIGRPVGVPAPARVLVVDDALRATGPAGERRLREHLSGFGGEGLSGALRNELGVRIDHVAEVTESDLVRVLARVEPLDVTLPASIVEAGETVYEAGPVSLSATEFVTLLAFPFDDPSIDAATRQRIVAGAWAALAGEAGFDRATGLLDEPAATALEALASPERIEPLVIAETSNGVVLDEVAYRTQGTTFEGGWLDARPPWKRPRVELRGANLVEAMLLLIADGFRIDRVDDEPVEETRIEAADRVVGARLTRLLEGPEPIDPLEPLGSGIDARISLRSGA